MLCRSAAIAIRSPGMEIIITEFMTLDGVVQAPGGPREDTDGDFAHGGWSRPYFDVETMGGAWDDVIQRSDAMLFGRKTWEVSAKAWPQQGGNPFADRINSITKYVATRTLGEDDVAGWSGSTVLAGEDAIAGVRELRERDGRGVFVLGSATLAAQLAEHDLVDEYVLMIEPILVGGGKRVFPSDGASRPLELTGVKQAKTGVLVCTYRRVRE
jgi:dihydrofolate reductase